MSSSRKLRRARQGKAKVLTPQNVSEERAAEDLLDESNAHFAYHLNQQCTDFLLSPSEHVSPVKAYAGRMDAKWERELTARNLIQAFYRTLSAATSFLSVLAPGAEEIFEEELFNLQPNIKDEKLSAVRKRLLDQENTACYMRTYLFDTGCFTDGDSEAQTLAIRATNKQRTQSAKERIGEKLQLNRWSASEFITTRILGELSEHYDPDKRATQGTPRLLEDIKNETDIQVLKNQLSQTYVAHFEAVDLALCMLEEVMPGLGKAYVNRISDVVVTGPEDATDAQAEQA